MEYTVILSGAGINCESGIGLPLYAGPGMIVIGMFGTWSGSDFDASRSSKIHTDGWHCTVSQLEWQK